jgi:hypothetical protein
LTATQEIYLDATKKYTFTNDSAYYNFGNIALVMLQTITSSDMRIESSSVTVLLVKAKQCNS